FIHMHERYFFFLLIIQVKNIILRFLFIKWKAPITFEIHCIHEHCSKVFTKRRFNDIINFILSLFAYPIIDFICRLCILTINRSYFSVKILIDNLFIFTIYIVFLINSYTISYIKLYVVTIFFIQCFQKGLISFLRR